MYATHLNLSEKKNFIGIFLVYALVRIAIFCSYPIHYTPVYDAASYLAASAHSICELSFYFMPLTYASFLKIMHQNLLLIFISQLALSILIWSIFSYFIYKKIEPNYPRMALIIGGLILLWSCSTKLSVWDALGLTESLTISLLILYFYTFFSFVQSGMKNRYFGLGLLFSILLFANQRTANAYYLLFATPLFLYCLLRSKNKLGRIIFSFCLILIFSSFYFVSWSTNQSRIWYPSMGNIMSGHLAHYPTAMDYFSEQGMPTYAKKELELWADPTYPYYQGVRLFYMPETADWFIKNSRQVYTKYLLSHPDYALSPFSLDRSKPNNLYASIKAFNDNAEIYALFYLPPKAAHKSKEHKFFISSRTLTYFAVYTIDKITLLFSWFILPIMLILYVLLAIKHRRQFFSPLMFSAMYYLLLAIPIFLFVWHADSGEPGRHQLLTYVDVYLSLFLGLAFLLAEKRTD